MSNTIASGLQRSVIMESALVAMRPIALVLGAFSTAFRNVPLEGTNKMLVPYFPLATDASRDFNGTYVFDGSSTDLREVEINKRKYQSLALSSAEIARQPQLKPEVIGMLKGQKLARDVIADILSIFTVANYGTTGTWTPIFTGAASTFDSDDITDMALAVDLLNWPDESRSLILSSAYHRAVEKDTDLRNLANSGTIDPLTRGVLPNISGFTPRKTNSLPGNGENLVGLAVHSSAALVGFAPIPPAGRLRDIVDYQTMEDPETGLVLEYRSWADGDTDTIKETIEVNYGYGVGEKAAAQRMISA